MLGRNPTKVRNNRTAAQSQCGRATDTIIPFFLPGLGFGRHLIGLFRSHVDPKAKQEAGHSFRMTFRSLIERFQQIFLALFREFRLSLKAGLQSDPNRFGESRDRVTSQELLAAGCCSELFSEVGITDERQ